MWRGAARCAGRGAGRRARRGARALPLLLAALLSHAVGDYVFRVPEVLVQHTAAPRAVGSVSVPGAAGGAGGAGGAAGGAGALRVQYEEYFVEHEVSTADARLAARALDLGSVSAPVGCGACSAREAAYCAARALADHCCCERRPLPEPLPWLPHSCYVGPARCRVVARDCARYARLRDCCCLPVLAAKWKNILSGSPRAAPAAAALAAATLLRLARAV